MKLAEQNPSDQVQDLHGDLAWPTLLLFVLGITLLLFSIALGTYEVLPIWSSIILSTLGLYLLFTPAHEAVHGNIKGRSNLPIPIESFVGWISAGAFLFPYPVFSYNHRTHHKDTNHPERDPDFWVAGKHPLTVLFSCMSMLPDYYYYYFKRSKKLLANEFEREGFIATFFFLLLVSAAFITMGEVWGYWVPLLLWFLPALIASTFLAFVFDYLPHRPHNERKRYLDTRITLGPGLNVLLISQNLHLIHHLYPSIPFYKYNVAFQRLRTHLVEKGARIDDLSSPISSRTNSAANIDT